MGVFNSRKSSFYESLSTNLKAVHNIPSIGFVISATANVMWREGSWMKYLNDEIPTQYISVENGKVYNLTEEMLKMDEFKKLDVRQDLDVRRNIKDSYMSPVLCMNVNVTKEIKDFLRISFYATTHSAALRCGRAARLRARSVAVTTVPSSSVCRSMQQLNS